MSLPVGPGILPISSSTHLMRFSDACGAEISRWIRLRLQSLGERCDVDQGLCSGRDDDLCDQLAIGRVHLRGTDRSACATPREGMADWLASTAQALSYFGGAPQLIVPDNPRALIANPNRYEPRANETVEDFARHYATSVLPARRTTRRPSPRLNRPCRWSSAGFRCACATRALPAWAMSMKPSPPCWNA